MKLIKTLLFLLISYLVTANEYSVVIIGKTGVGKSSLINSLFGEQVATVGHDEATTMNVEKYTKYEGNHTINIWDTMGLYDDRGEPKEYIHRIADTVKKAHLVLFCFDSSEARWTKDNKDILDIIKKQFYKKNTVPICGYQLPEIENAKDRKIYPLFFKYFIPWGWFVTYKDWNEYRSSKSTAKKDFIKNDKLFSQIKKIAEKKNKKIWSLKFIEYNLIRKRKIIFPNKSLIKNIGFDGSGVNSSITDKFNSFYTAIKRINVAKVHQNIILQEKQLLILSKRVKYFF